MADQLQLNSLVLDARRLAVNLVQVNQQVSQVVAQTPKVEGLSDALEKSKLGELDIGALLKGEGLAAPFVSGIKAALAFEQHMHDLQLGPVKDDPLENTGLQRDALAQMLPEAGMRQGQESLEQLQGAIKGVTLAFGLALLPAFTAVAQALKPLIQGVASLIVAHPQLVEGVAAAAAAFTGLRVAATLALLAFNATPIGLVVSAVALAVGLIVAYWEPISGFFAAVGERVGAVFQAMGAAFEALLQWDPMATLQSGWSALSGFFSELWASTLTGLQSAWGMLKAVLAWSRWHCCTTTGGVSRAGSPISQAGYSGRSRWLGRGCRPCWPGIHWCCCTTTGAPSLAGWVIWRARPSVCWRKVGRQSPGYSNGRL
ncbi:phage tail tape measure protein [Pseudomonas mosselii]|uniref:phage tail tape measure protein n=1 Tax=Pseudomonas mosselii TaxID=78327 RepID=UPI003D26F3E9